MIANEKAMLYSGAPMGNKQRAKRGPKRARKKIAFKHSFVLGVMSDGWTLLRWLFALIAWPVRTLATAIHRQIAPRWRFKHSHAVTCIALGVLVLGVSFTIENLFHHPAWGIPVETMRAAGVCPIWESLSAMMKLSEDFA